MKINKRLLTRLKNKCIDNTNENKQEVVDTSQKNKRVDNTYESKQEVVDTSQNIASKTPTKI